MECNRRVVWRPGAPRWRLSNFGTLLVFVAACSFETQPIFSPPPSALTASDAGTGQKTAATQGAAGAMPVADAGPSRSDAATPPPPPAGSDAGLTGCQPGEISMCLLGTQIICNSLGTGVVFSSCLGLGCSPDNKHCNGCTPGQLSCRDANTLVTCAANGQPTSQTCPMGCSATSGIAACNGCMPGTMSCADAHTLRTCDASGVNADSTCAMGCGTEVGIAACHACTPNKASCQGTQLVQCSATGQIASSTPCPHTCDAATAQCTTARLVPANLPADTCTTPATEAGDFSDDAIIDTDNDCSAVVQQPAGAPEICVLRYLDLKILAGVTVRARGSRVLALVATHSMTIDGTLSAGAEGSIAGPGAFATGPGVGLDGTARADGMMMSTDIPANAGGGGAGYAVKGASGGDAPGMCGPGPAGCADPGGGGMRYGMETIVPLAGGSRGGHNSAAAGSSRLTVAGGGGGALQLVSCGDMTVGAAALIDAAGGGGSGGLVGSNSGESKTPGAGAGGGSGGAILLEALSFHLRAGAILVANGGGGGGGAVRGGNGNGNGNPPAPGQPGEDGRGGTMPAAGGEAGGGNSRAGGSGGTTLPPTAGGTVDDTDSAAGGGGGAAGRIRIDAPTGAVDQTGVVTSPRPSVGVVATD